MSRTFPPQIVYTAANLGQPLASRSGSFVTVYRDAALTVVESNLQLAAGNVPVPDGRVLIDATSRTPRLRLAGDTVTQLYAKPDGSIIATPIFADAEEVLAAANATFLSQAAGTGLTVGATASRVNEVRADALVLTGLVPRPRFNPPAMRQFVRGEGQSAPNIASGGSGYVVGDEVTMAGGTFTHAAIYRVASVSAGAITSVTIVRAGNYSVRAVNPAAQDTTTGVGTGATFTANYNSTLGSTIRNAVLVGPLDARTRFTGVGPANISSSGFYGQSAGQGTNCVWEWETDSTQIDIRQIGINTRSVLYVDDVQLEGGKWDTDASGAGSIFSIDWAGAARMRRYRLVSANSGFGGYRVTATAVMQTTPQAVQKPLAYGLGDSYMFGTGAENVSTQAFTVMCEQLGLEPLADGVGGAGYSGTTAADRVTAKAALTRTPAYVFMDMGYNNAGGDQTALATAFDGAVTAIRSAWPAAVIIAFGPATPLGETTNLAAVKATIQARAAAASIPFVDTSSYVTSTNKALYTGGDNVHPTVLGHKYIGARKALDVRPLLPL